MPKVRESVDPDGKHRGWVIFCPACGHGHQFDDRWTFNGDMEKPTFRASMLSRWRGPVLDPGKNYGTGPDVDHVCHSFVTDGRIEFLGDCTHELRGQTVDLLDL